MADPTLVYVSDLEGTDEEEDPMKTMHSNDISGWKRHDERDRDARGSSVGRGIYAVKGIAGLNARDGGIPRSTGEFAHPEDSRFMSEKFQSSIIEREKLLRNNPCWMFWKKVMAALADKSGDGSPFDEDRVNNTLRREADQRAADESVKDVRIKINDLSAERSKIMDIVSQTAEDVARVEGRIGRDPVLRQLEMTKKALFDLMDSLSYISSRLRWYLLLKTYQKNDDASAGTSKAMVSLKKDFEASIRSGYVSEDSSRIIQGSRFDLTALYKKASVERIDGVPDDEVMSSIKSIVAEEAGIPDDDDLLNGNETTLDTLFRKVLVVGLAIHMKNMFALMRAEITLVRSETTLPSVVSSTMEGVGTFANLARLRAEAIEAERKGQFDEDAFLSRMDHEFKLRERMAGVDARPKTLPMKTTVVKDVSQVQPGETGLTVVSKETTTTTTTPLQGKEEKTADEDADTDDDDLDDLDPFGFKRDTHTESLFSGAAFMDTVDRLSDLVSIFEEHAGEPQAGVPEYDDVTSLLGYLNDVGGIGILDVGQFTFLDTSGGSGTGGARAAAARGSMIKFDKGFTKKEMHETFSLFAKMGGYWSMYRLSILGGDAARNDPLERVRFPFTREADSYVNSEDKPSLSMDTPRTDMLHPIMMALFDTVHSAVVKQAKKYEDTPKPGIRKILSRSERVIYDNITHGLVEIYQDSAIYASVIYRIYLMITANNLRANQAENEKWYSVITERWTNAVRGIPSTIQAANTTYTVENRYAMTPQMSGVFMVRTSLILALDTAWMYLSQNPLVKRSGVTKESIMSKDDMLSNALANYTGLTARGTEIRSRRDYQPRGAIAEQKAETVIAVDMFLRLFRQKFSPGMAQLNVGSPSARYRVFR